MNKFCTNFFALDLTDGIVKKFQGQNIYADSWEKAEEICKNQFPYLEIEGKLICELNEFTLKEININLN